MNYLNVIMRKQQTNENWRTFYKTSGLYTSKMPMLKTEEYSKLKRDQRNMITEFNTRCEFSFAIKDTNEMIGRTWKWFVDYCVNVNFLILITIQWLCKKMSLFLLDIHRSFQSKRTSYLQLFSNDSKIVCVYVCRMGGIKGWSKGDKVLIFGESR